MSPHPASRPPAQPPYAHSLDGRPETEWETLPEHLLAVGDTARALAAYFGAGEAARLAGYLHDIGKISPEFQAYIKGRGASPNHAGAGARVAETLFDRPLDRVIAQLVSHAIVGHHAGLPDVAGPTGMAGERARVLPDYTSWRDVVPDLPATLPLPVTRAPNGQGYALAFLGRMIFSALVDADSIETGRFYAEAKGETVARGGHASLEELRDRLNRHLARFEGAGGALNAHRAAILRDARERAELPPGLFTMTVPTGGGKTLAGLAFALDHAIRHGLRRVIYVIPYNSIVEQTAAIFRKALVAPDGTAPDVLEHTGNVDWDEARTPAERDALGALRVASENWDVPVVVTSAVQFFESLHANRRSRCRKLHNIAGSVVVLDEAQTLPLALLRPCLAALDELAQRYRTSIVLCTATQPAVRRCDGFVGGLDIAPGRELASDPAALYAALRRVTVEHAGPTDDAALAARFAEQERMLCIVNGRRQAQALFALIADLPGARHLTTLMCPAHRRSVLAEARVALKEGRPVRLVSTSLIEAGVDVDFPEVWRAQAGLDSVAQAAGRCNRENAPAKGRVVVFEASDHPLAPAFKPFADAMATAWAAHPDDPLGPAAIKAYFDALYWRRSRAPDAFDEARIGGARFPILPALAASFGARAVPEPPYASVAEAFRMIDDPGRPVIVPWRGGDEPDEVDRLVRELTFADLPPGRTLRRLQHYTVSIPRAAYDAMLACRAIQPVAEAKYGDRFMLVQDVGLYRETTGMALDPFGGDGLGPF